MATKKQKRAAALAKRERFLEEERARGLAAQQDDRERQLVREVVFKAEADRINSRYANILNSNVFARLIKEENDQA